MDINIRIGCCGFPVARKKYYLYLKLVELQQTFYQPPQLETVQEWRESSPDDFEFTIKAWQLITHPPSSPTYRKLKIVIPEKKREHYGYFQPTEEVFSAWEYTERIARLLDTKLIIFQSPSSFIPIDKYVKNMYQFFSSINREGFFFVWEPRGAWPENIIKEICEDLALIHCVDPFKNEPLSGVLTYLRLHGKSGYNYHYKDEELKWLEKEVRKRRQPVYVMFNNTYMFDDAQRFINLISRIQKSS